MNKNVEEIYVLRKTELRCIESFLSDIPFIFLYQCLGNGNKVVCSCKPEHELVVPLGKLEVGDWKFPFSLYLLDLPVYRALSSAKKYAFFISLASLLLNSTKINMTATLHSGAGQLFRLPSVLLKQPLGEL